MQKAKTICFAVLVLAVGAVSALGGELTPVACDPDQTVFPPLMLRGSVTGKAKPDTVGLTDKAVLGNMSIPARSRSEEKPFARFALDYSKQDATYADLLLLDFTGDGKFDKTKAIVLRPIKAQKGVDYQAEFGPAQASTQREGKTFPLLLRGAVLCLPGGPAGKRYMLSVAVAPALQGKCRFGQAEHTVRIIDNTGDFRFESKGAFDPKKPGPMGAGTGDIVLVDTADGTFAHPAVKAFFGQLLWVNGQWYNLKFSADASQLSAEKADVSAGQLQIDADKWELVLSQAGKLTMLSGDRQPVLVPAGKYDITFCRRWSAPNDKGLRSWLLAVNMQLLSGKGSASAITIAAEKKTNLPIGSPLSTSLTAKPAGGKVDFSLETPTIQPGLSVVIITSLGDIYSRPNEPKVTLTDANGKLVAEFSMEYG